MKLGKSNNKKRYGYYGVFGSNDGSSTCYKYIIGEIARYTNCKTYLELGVYHGDTFQYMSSIVENTIGVDMMDMRQSKVGTFFQMSTDDFFKKNKKRVDIVFIDADHNIKSVIRDFENSLKILNRLGIIFIHDTDPKSKEFIKRNRCNDAYKIISYIEKKHPSLNIVTLPISEAGLSMVMRKKDRRIYNYLH